MQPTLHASGHARKLEARSETWGAMCWLIEDQLVPSAGVSVARMTINAEAISPTHRHPNCNETIVLLSGNVTCIVDDQEYLIKAGDVVFVPRGSAHAIRNETNQAAVAMLSYSAGARVYEPIKTSE
jgi:quercetin dioxygenase-like cupin family protein